MPPDDEALAEVERREEAPASLVLAAADALRLSGQYGRARSLVLRALGEGGPVSMGETPRPPAQPGTHRATAALAAEVLRRAGDLALAEATAREAMDAAADPEGRARAVLARIAFDRGDVDAAERLCAAEGGTSTALCEVAALCAWARGDTAQALAEVARGEALAGSAEERARCAGFRGYVGYAADPEGTHAAFASAVDHAVRAGAVVEEATYRTGEAGAAVDLGELGSAVATTRRAALLWEHLGKPAHAARALLNAAAAYAAAGAVHEAVSTAHEAMARARDGGDVRAEAYAFWHVADASAAGSAEGLAAAERAAALLSGMSAGREDELRGAARLLRHGGLDAARLDDLDRLASSSPVESVAPAVAPAAPGPPR